MNRALEAGVYAWCLFTSANAVETVFSYLDSSGSRRVAKVSGRPVFDENGTFMGYRGVGCDITLEMEAEKRIRYLAQRDALTGLPNRLLLKDRLEQVLATARRMRRRLAVLCIDLDDFKMVNDTLGHPAEDEMLRAAGSGCSAA